MFINQNIRMETQIIIKNKIKDLFICNVNSKSNQPTKNQVFENYRTRMFKLECYGKVVCLEIITGLLRLF